MKKLAAWSLWLDGCIWGAVSVMGTAQAAPPPDVVIATADEARAFSDSAPFIFSGQSLSVHHGFATDRTIELERLASVIAGSGTHFELRGVISSNAPPLSAALEKRGPGTLALTGQNRYTSNTVLREGVLRLGGVSALGDGLYSLEQHGGTVLQLEAGARLVNFIQLVDTVPGDRPLPGLAGVAEWRVDAGHATLANNVNAMLPVRKTGGGTLQLAGVVQGHPSLLVEAGALAVDSTAAARVVVASGARLEGRGELAQLRVQAGGMAAPGGRDLPGSLSVWGDAVFDAGSLYHVNALPDGRADLLRVGGQAVLDGRVLAQAGDGDWAPEHRYLILSADAGLGGTRFAQVDTDLAFLEPALEYDDHGVYLALRRNDLEPGDVAETPDEKEVGDAIAPPEHTRRPRRPRSPAVPVEPAEPGPPADPGPGKETPAIPGPPAPEPEPAAPERPDAKPLAPSAEREDSSAPDTEPHAADAWPLTPLRQAMQGMSVEQTRALLRQSSGSWHASVRSFLLEDSRHVRQAVLASGRDAWGRYHEAAAGGDHQGMDGAHEPAWRRASADGPRAWAQMYSAAGRRRAVSGVEGDRHGSRGIVLGLDAQASRHWRPGLVVAVQHARLQRAGRQAHASVDSLYAGLSAHGEWNGMRLTTALLRAWHRIDSRRRVSAGPLRELQRSAYTGRSWQAVMELVPHLRSLREWGEWLRSGLGATDHIPGRGARIRAAARDTPGGTASGPGMGPYVHHEWAHLGLPGHEESGGMAAHAVQPANTTLHATTLGWRLRYGWPAAGGPSWLEADVGWRRAWGGGRVFSTQRLLTGEQPRQASRLFTSQGQPLASNALALALEAGLAPSRQARLSFRYTGLYGGAYRDHAAWADLRWVF